MEEQNLTPKDSLRVIQNMIEDSKERFRDNGYIYLFWGWLIIVCALAQFVLLQLEYYEIHFYPYFLTIPAAIYTWFYEARRHRKKSKPTFLSKFFAALWTVIGFNIFLTGFGFGYAFHISPIPFIMILISIAIILSGTMVKFRPLIIGGIICNGLVIVSLFTPTVYYPVIVALALIAAYLIPGYILRNKYKKHHEKEGGSATA